MVISRDLFVSLMMLLTFDFDNGINLKGIINIGNNREISINNLAYKINKMAGFNNKIIHMELPEDEPQRRLPALNRAKDELNWHPIFIK